MRTAVGLGIVALVAFVTAPSARAQSRPTSADLIGTVTDQTGAVLIGASVSATNTETNITRSVVTADDGHYVVPALPPGVYTVRVAHTGFTTQVLERVVLTLGSASALDVTLQLAGVRQEVTVVPTGRAVDLERTAVSSVIDRHQIDALPINGRNFINFSLLTPGTAVDRTPQQGVSQTTGLNFAGQHARSNNITIDGLDNNDLIIGSVREAFSQEAVREFQVLTNAYSAEFGKASGGVVNIVTKSGTNRFAGGAFVFVRDETLNAKEHFELFDVTGAPISRAKAPYSQQQFGGTFGGPVRHDRTFFFGSFERLDVAANNFVTIDDQTAVLHPLTNVPLGTPAGILRQAGFSVETGHVPYAITSTPALGKVTHQFRRPQSFNVRFNWTKGLNENIEPFGGLVARSRAGASNTTNVVGVGEHTSVFSSSTVNEFRAQVVNHDVELDALDPSCGGPCIREDQGGPNLEITGVASLGRQRTTPTIRNSIRTQLVDTVSLYRGKHELKAGFDFSHVRFDKYAVPLSFGGRFIFGALPAIPGVVDEPVSAIQAVALGLPAAYVQGYGNSIVAFNYNDLSLFVQDNWRLGERLTLKLGLRYQRQFWPPDTYTVSGYPGAYSFPQDRNDLAPRIAMSWRPGGRRFSVRTAYGMFFDNNIAALRGVPSIIDGTDNVRTLVLRLPRSIDAWNAPGRRLPEFAVPSFPSVMITIDPRLKTPYAHHVVAGMTRELPGEIFLSADGLFVRGFNLVGTIDYNPLVPALGAGRRPADVDDVPGTSASVLQYTSFGETWYRGLTLSLEKRFSGRHQFAASYTLSKAEDTSTDFQSAFIVQDSGLGRHPSDPNGLPLGFIRRADRGLANHDQRHRLVVSGGSLLPAQFETAAILTLGSGRPYNILAGSDLNGDGDGGAFPSDRARRIPADASTSVPRNSGKMPLQATIDARLSRAFRLSGSVNIDVILEVFNLFNRVNFTDVNGIFGRGAYPLGALPSFGRFEQAGPPRQVQVAAKLRF